VSNYARDLLYHFSIRGRANPKTIQQSPPSLFLDELYPLNKLRILPILLKEIPIPNAPIFISDRDLSTFVICSTGDTGDKINNTRMMKDRNNKDKEGSQ
jgi:hypothetical protein